MTIPPPMPPAKLAELLAIYTIPPKRWMVSYKNQRTPDLPGRVYGPFPTITKAREVASELLEGKDEYYACWIYEDKRITRRKGRKTQP